jgi:hypothetical protein
MVYSPAGYDTLPSLAEAAGEFKKRQAKQLLEGEIRQLFLDNNVQTLYGVSLLHKHFAIEAKQRLVDYHHVATPWTFDDESSEILQKYDGYIVPRTYRFFGNRKIPYEFAFQNEACSMEEDADFKEQFSDLLQKLDLAHLFGLRVLGDHDPNFPVEITEGRASIMLPRGAVPDSEMIEALWTFGLEDDDRCHCREVCWPTKTGDGKDDHLKDHSCG